MPQNIYDDPEFFDGYQRLRSERLSMNEVVEQPNLRRLLPDDLTGLRVLDMGCGAGEMCRWLAEQGAASVTGMDISQRMLEKAAERHDERVIYINTSAEEASFEPASFDLVVSSLMLHYVENVSPLFQKIHTWLAGGGRYVFSMEHPITTAGQGLLEPPWDRDETGDPLAWRLANYKNEGRRVSTWFVDGVVKYHRTMETVINSLIDAGFSLSRVLEPHAPEEAELADPEFLKERARPSFLFVSAEAV